ncbi:MAG: hypothetical protein WBV73_20540 [Phormidium sp.]
MGQYEKMEQIVEQVKEAIGAAVELIKTQKQTIVDLKTKLGGVSEEYAQFQQAESEEDAAADAMMQQLEQIAESLSNVVSEAQSEAEEED